MADSTKTKIHINDSKAKRIFRELEELKSIAMEQVIKGTHYGRDTAGRFSSKQPSIAQVAAWMEFGAGRVPKRPFLRRAQFESDAVQKVFKEEVFAIVHGNRTAKTAARRVARMMAALAVKAIDESPSWAKPLAALTVARKGHDHPLIDTRQLRNHIYWRTKKGGQTLEEGLP